MVNLPSSDGRGFRAAMRRVRLHRGLSALDFADKLGMRASDVLRVEADGAGVDGDSRKVEAMRIQYLMDVANVFELTDAEFDTITQGSMGVLTPPFPTPREVNMIHELLCAEGPLALGGEPE